MSTATLAGVLLVVVPIAFNVAFALLAARFDYPDILRRPTAEVLERFRAGGAGLIALWWAFAATAILMAPLTVLLAQAATGADGALLAVATALGVLAALVQTLGLLRWPFLVPLLARIAADDEASPARREAAVVVFEAFHRYLGVAVGEHLGYLFTGAWTTLAGVALTQSSATPHGLGVAGIVVGPVLALCALESVDARAEKVTPVAYVAWSLWLMATGVALLV